MTTTRLLVDGMTCEHRVAAVTAEVSAVDGVREVTIDLVPGDASTVSITSDGPLDPAQAAAAIDEAGYTLATVERTREKP